MKLRRELTTTNSNSASTPSKPNPNPLQYSPQSPSRHLNHLSPQDSPSNASNPTPKDDSPWTQVSETLTPNSVSEMSKMTGIGDWSIRGAGCCSYRDNEFLTAPIASLFSPWVNVESIKEEAVALSYMKSSSSSSTSYRLSSNPADMDGFSILSVAFLPRHPSLPPSISLF